MTRLILCLGFFTLGISVSWAFRAPDRPPLPNVDVRTKPGAAAKPSAAQKAAVKQLRGELPTAKADFDPITGGPKFITGGREFLTGPNGAGKAVPSAAAQQFAADPHGPTKAFLQSHRNLFGFGPEALDKLAPARDTTASHNGVRTVIWQQQVQGIPVFEAKLISHTTRRGELMSISSQFVPNPDAAARIGGKDIAKLVSAPPVDAAGAVAIAAQNVGEKTLSSQLKTEPALGAAGPEQKQKWRGPGLNGKADAGLVWVPMSSGELRLGWEVVMVSRGRGEMFRLLVDASTGQVLVRHCLTEYFSNATYRVFTNDSPSPLSPGWPTPSSAQPPLISRSLVTLPALDTNASPQGWIPDGGNQTLGNNVDAHTDTNSDDIADLPRPQGSPFRVFDFPMDLSTQDPSAYQSAAVVQLFYWNNFMHDRLYELGFDEAAGNFQTDNFGRGGLGNDAVQADAQDGSGFNNANFSTPPDGSAGRMQMYIFDSPSPRRDGDLDAEIVLHEYAHGLSGRHVAGGAGITALQSRGMGEGWSDFYALSLLSQSDDNVNACFAAGAYASYLIGGPADNRNYYFGIRRYPYSTDLAKNPLTLKDIDPSQAAYCGSAAPFHTGSIFGNCSPSGADEVHNQGEVWCVTLWEGRANLIAKYGWAVGNELMLQLVTDGMLYSPPNPNFLQARDGILQADLVDTGGANQKELWAGFAKRGMGSSAIAPPSGTTSGIQESFDLPDDLRITPPAGFVSSGPVGGPFTVISTNFFLTNSGASALDWSVANTSPWLNVSGSNGSLLPGGPDATVNVTINASANFLPAGVYDSTLLFTNLMSRAVQGRSVRLRVGQPDYYTEWFVANNNDLAYHTLTFTPDGSPSFYSACIEPASVFPTDPGGGNVVSLADDDFYEVTLSSGNVGLYGRNTNTFFIGSNGYLTLGAGDDAYEENYPAHFSLPRISALFHDQLPVSQTVISWQELPDRAVVTYQGLSDIMETGLNDFQIEWFFDGRIRITWLGLTNRQNLVGLSAGAGVPFGYQDYDLSAGGSCNPLRVSLPASVTEGDGLLANVGQVILPAAYGTNVPVSLSSSDPASVSVPSSLVVPAGQVSLNFNLNVADNSILDGTRKARITATVNGVGSASQAIQVYDNEHAVLTLSAPGSVIEGQGTAEALLTLNAPPGANTFVELSSSDTNKLAVPSAVALVPGQTSVVFTISVLDNFQTNLPEDVVISAHVQNWTDASAQINVLDNPNPVKIVANTGLITVPDSGPATPYPSGLVVSGVAGLVSKVTVTLSGIFHTYPDDLAILLVSPSGTNVLLMSNTGGGSDLNGVTLTFDDAATASLPDSTQIYSGTYRPTPLTPPTLPAPAPSSWRSPTLSGFNGTDPNGTWNLFVYDDAAGDNGHINDGWSLSLRTTVPAAPRPVLLPVGVSVQGLEFHFASTAGHTYFVEYAQDATTNSWLPLRTLAGDGSVKTIIDPAGGNQRFYRVRVQ